MKKKIIIGTIALCIAISFMTTTKKNIEKHDLDHFNRTVYPEVSVSVNDLYGAVPESLPNYSIYYTSEITYDKKFSSYVLEDGYKIVNKVYEEDKTTSWNQIDSIVERECAKYDCLDISFIYAIIRKESGFQSDAFSSAKCIGLMQMNPKWQKQRMESLGCTNLFDPEENIIVGCNFMASLVSQYGEDMAMRVYLCGAANAGKESFQAQGDNYIACVRKYQQEYIDNYM